MMLNKARKAQKKDREMKSLPILVLWYICKVFVARSISGKLPLTDFNQI